MPRNKKGKAKNAVVRQWRLKPTQIIAITFATIILLGALLLALPVASRNGESIGPIPALFTATSATCVTGLVLFDTWTQFSGFGQIVIISLIEIGGLGFMSAASLVVFMLRRKIGLREKMLIAQALSVNEMENVVRIQKWVLVGSLLIQLTGALVLFFHFLPDYGLKKAVVWGVFHAISAFCNAGFDVFGYIEPGQSVAMFNTDPVVMITLMVLVVVGGLGFFVWEEVVMRRSVRKFSVYTKLVLMITGALIIGGALLVALTEWDNPGTIGNMSVGDKILNAFFQSVTTRTAGFAGFDQAKLTDGGKALSIMLMAIGGSSGSTAGGIKTVTFMVLIAFVIARARGKNSVNVFHRNIPNNKILDAVTIVSIVVGLTIVGGIVITTTSPVGFTDGLFESISALATVGLTAGATTSLSLPALLLMILFMYFGRVGILTISLGFLAGNKAEDKIRYADTNLLIG